MVWEYYAKVLKVVDGDTLDLRVDLGFTASVDIRVRLHGINTPEIHGVKQESLEYAAGLAAESFVIDWLVEAAKGLGTVLDAPVRIVSHDGDKLHTGKYGRWIAEIYRDGDLVSLNAALVGAGHAELVEYG